MGEAGHVILEKKRYEGVGLGTAFWCGRRGPMMLRIEGPVGKVSCCDETGPPLHLYNQKGTGFLQETRA
jgi:hypothetical protein